MGRGVFTYSQGVWLRGACSASCVTVLSILDYFLIKPVKQQLCVVGFLPVLQPLYPNQCTDVGTAALY